MFALRLESGLLMQSPDMKAAAVDYAKAGLFIHPLVPGEKRPLLDDWPNKATNEPAMVEEWWTRWPEANIGVHVGKSGLLVVDKDPRNGGDESFRMLDEQHGTAWHSNIEVKTGGGGVHLFYAATSDASYPSQAAPGIDLKHGVAYIVAPPSKHPSGERYEVVRGGLVGDEIDFLPSVPRWLSEGKARPLVAVEDWTSGIRAQDPETQENIDRLQSALFHISADCDRAAWRNVLFAIFSTGWACAEEIAREWSMLAPDRFDEGGFQNVINSAKSDKPNGITVGTIYALAKENGWKDPRKAQQHFETFGDISNGRRFAERYRGKLLFVHATGKWYAWNGGRWAPCDNGESLAAAKTIADECVSEAAAALKDDATESAKRNFTQAVGVHRNVRRAEAMLQMAASEQGMSIAHPGLFDSNPWLLGVRNGVLDLRNGELLDARPEMMVSRQAGAVFDWQSVCPTWEKFLSDAMQGDEEVISFLTRVCGYALTGLVDEETLFFMLGNGANGKSVFANVLAAVLGDYAVTVRATLLARDPKGNGSDAEREKARLPGARVALVNETGQGDMWDDQRLKEVVSREDISARQLYGESFAFPPTHKIFVRGNHQPGSMDVSDGFWRRINLISFSHKVPAAERIPDLDRRIVDKELPGVLRWMVAGCLEWRKYGLKVPRSISQAIAAYRSETDLLGEWLESCCTVSPSAVGDVGSLFASYERFLREANTRAPSRIAFGRQLVARGFEKHRSNGMSRYRGVAVGNPSVLEDDL